MLEFDLLGWRLLIHVKETQWVKRNLVQRFPILAIYKNRGWAIVGDMLKYVVYTSVYSGRHTIFLSH